LELIANLIGDYYGLDWLTLAFGLSGTYFLTNRAMITGFTLCALACICGFTVAIMAHQMGFIAYNALLLVINLRGIFRGDRRKDRASDPVFLFPKLKPVTVSRRVRGR